MKSNCRAADQRIKKLAGRINELASQAVSLYSLEVDLIIVSDCKDKRRIEHILEGMLDFCFDKSMLELYRKLCRYYYDINPRGTAEYVYAYRNMRERGETGANQ